MSAIFQLRSAKVSPPLRVGISACLLGQNVRYDGGHKRDRLIAERLGPMVEWVPVCPEVELGLGVPRETLRLEGPSGAPRLVFTESREDITDRMRAWSRRRLRLLRALELCGYVLKSRSPSCGLRVEMHAAPRGAATLRRRGRRSSGKGLFAHALVRQFPDLPVEEEEGLHDPARLRRFLALMRAYRRRRAAGRKA